LSNSIAWAFGNISKRSLVLAGSKNFDVLEDQMASIFAERMASNDNFPLEYSCRECFSRLAGEILGL
jgi:hypothetical protein